MKTISIKGKDYVPVNERILEFHKLYKNGSIRTELISEPTSKEIVVKATVIPNIEKLDGYFTGYAQEVIGDGLVNKTSALENAETSAVGRGLGMLGIGVLESIASADEIVKATNRVGTKENPEIDYGNRTVPTCEHCGAKGVWNEAYQFWGCPNYKKEKEQGLKTKMKFPEQESTIPPDTEDGSPF